MTKTIKLLTIVSYLLFGVYAKVFAEPSRDAEVSVVRPRFINKQYKFELSTSAIGINRTYQQTVLGGGSLSFYPMEWLSIDGYGSYGFSFNTAVKDTLNEEKDINELDSTTKYIYGLGISLSPMYGKFQIASGSLFYFDTFFSLGAGLINKRYEYEHCIEFEGDKTIQTRDPETIAYTNFIVGVGQHYFINRSSSFNWSFKFSAYENYSADLKCKKEKDKKMTWSNDLMLQIGLSYFLGV
jgi:outer membrane beta-barrel protein